MGLMDLSAWAAALIYPTLFGLGLTMAAPPHEEYRYARGCFWLSAVVLWGFAIVWGWKSHYSFPVRAGVVAIMASVASIGLMTGFRLVASREKSALYSQYPTRHNLTESQREELIALDNYVSVDKSFFLLGQVAYNVLVQARRTEFIRNNPGRAFPYSQYTNGGAVILDVRDDNWDHRPVGIGMTIGNNGVRITESPEDVSYFIARPEDVADQSKLTEFMNSITLPDIVMNALRAYKVVRDKNYGMIGSILNEYRHKDLRYFSDAGKASGQFSNAVYNEFGRRMVPMNPAQEAVRASIREALK